MNFKIVVGDEGINGHEVLCSFRCGAGVGQSNVDQMIEIVVALFSNSSAVSYMKELIHGLGNTKSDRISALANQTTTNLGFHEYIGNEKKNIVTIDNMERCLSMFSKEKVVDYLKNDHDMRLDLMLLFSSLNLCVIMQSGVDGVSGLHKSLQRLFCCYHSEPLREGKVVFKNKIMRLSGMMVVLEDLCLKSSTHIHGLEGSDQQKTLSEFIRSSKALNKNLRDVRDVLVIQTGDLWNMNKKILNKEAEIERVANILRRSRRRDRNVRRSFESENDIRSFVSENDIRSIRDDVAQRSQSLFKAMEVKKITESVLSAAKEDFAAIEERNDTMNKVFIPVHRCADTVYFAANLQNIEQQMQEERKREIKCIKMQIAQIENGVGTTVANEWPVCEDDIADRRARMQKEAEQQAYYERKYENLVDKAGIERDSLKQPQARGGQGREAGLKGRAITFTRGRSASIATNDRVPSAARGRALSLLHPNDQIERYRAKGSGQYRSAGNACNESSFYADGLDEDEAGEHNVSGCCDFANRARRLARRVKRVFVGDASLARRVKRAFVRNANKEPSSHSDDIAIDDEIKGEFEDVKGEFSPSTNLSSCSSESNRFNNTGLDEEGRCAECGVWGHVV